MKTTKIFTFLLALMSVFLLVGCGKDTIKEAEEVTYDFEAEIEKTYFVDPLEYTDFIKNLPVAPDFSKDVTTALETYQAAANIENLEAGKYYLANGQNHLLVDDSGAIRVVNPSTQSVKLTDTKVFRTENEKLVLLGMKAIDECRVPVMITIMDDGTILKETVYDKINSIDTIGLDVEIIMKAQHMTLASKGTSLKFYRFGEEISGEYQMPKKVDGAYSSLFLDEEGTLYLTLISTNKDKPWVQIAKVDENVKAITDKNFTAKTGYVFPIYIKELEEIEVEYTALMDMETYNTYVYMMYPSASDLTLQPNVNFQIIQPNDYTPEAGSDIEINEEEGTA